jgi:hypothetical protein
MNYRRLLYAATLLGVTCSASAYLLLGYQILVSPTSIYSMSFSGNATLTKNDLNITFVPSTITVSGVEAVDLRITATNIGNSDRTLYYADWAPVVHVYSGNQEVSTLRKVRISDTIGYLHVLKPGESYTVEWRWGIGSYASSPISQGVYMVSATDFYGDLPDRSYVSGWETPKVPMTVSFRIPNLLIIGLVLTILTAILAYCYRKKR